MGRRSGGSLVTADLYYTVWEPARGDNPFAAIGQPHAPTAVFRSDVYGSLFAFD